MTRGAAGGPALGTRRCWSLLAVTGHPRTARRRPERLGSDLLRYGT